MDGPLTASTFSTAPDLSNTIVETLTNPPFSIESLRTLKAAVDDIELLNEMVAACVVAMGFILDDEGEQLEADAIAVRLRRARIKGALVAAASLKEESVRAKASVDMLLTSAKDIWGYLPNNDLVPFPHTVEAISKDKYGFIEFKAYPEFSSTVKGSTIQFTPDGQAVETAKLPVGKAPACYEQWLPLMLQWALTIFILEGKGDLVHVVEYATRIASISSKHGFAKAQSFDRRYRQRMLLCMRRLQSNVVQGVGEKKMDDHDAFSSFLAKNLEPELLMEICSGESPVPPKPNAPRSSTPSKVVWEGTCKFTLEDCPFKDCKFAKHSVNPNQQKNGINGKRVGGVQGQGQKDSKSARR